MSENGDSSAELTKAETDYGWMVNTGSEKFEGLYGDVAKSAVIEELVTLGKGERKTQLEEFAHGLFLGNVTGALLSQSSTVMSAVQFRA